MRPRQSSLGIGSVRRRTRSARSASMRPRQSSLGIPRRPVVLELVLVASMRPRQSSLGIVQRPDAVARVNHGFNEAEAIKPRNLFSVALAVRHGVGASMRPRQSSLGIQWIQGDRPQETPASMRPRQSSLGIDDAGSTSQPVQPPASMRPRQSSLGICPTWTATRRSGESFNEAEAIKPRNRAPAVDASPQGTRFRRFNEAEAIKPRNQETTWHS